MDNVCKAMKQRSQQLRAASVDHAASVATEAASLSAMIDLVAAWLVKCMCVRAQLILLRMRVSEVCE